MPNVIGFYILFFASIGLIATALFHLNVYFPILLSVAIMAMVTLYLHSIYLHKRLGILIILIWIVYALPFLHIPPYILFDFNSSPTTLWGLAVNPYMLDEEVISLTAMIGAVGGCGIACGASLNRKRMQRDLGVDSNGDARLFLTINFSSSELTDLWVEVITNSTTIINEFLYLNFINQAPIF